MSSHWVPKDFSVPDTLETAEFKLRMLTVDDALKDYEAIMSSIKHLQQNPNPPICKDWPAFDLTLKQDIKDLNWHQQMHQAKKIFTYTVVKPDESKCLGCVYIFPSEDKKFDADLYFWVTKAEFDRGLDTRLFQALKNWLSHRWPFKNVRFPGRDS